MKVFLIEDGAVEATSLITLLSECGHEVKWSSNAEDALTKLSVWVPDIIICDLYMKIGMEGLGFLKERCKRPDLLSIPVIVASGGGEDLLKEVQETYHVHTVRKPFDPTILIDMIARPKSEDAEKNTLDMF